MVLAGRITPVSSDQDPTIHDPTAPYLIAPALVRRLNVWIVSQHLVLADKHDHDTTTWYVRTTGRSDGDADVSLREASHLLNIDEWELRRRAENGSIRSVQAIRIPISELRRIEAEGGGPSGDKLPL